MTSSTPISADRQLAIRLMASRGWQHQRRDRAHHFSRPDTGGWWDTKKVHHGSLSLAWAVSNCEDEELARRVDKTRSDWLAEVMPALEANNG